MRLKEKEEASADLDSQDIGIFVHGVLKKFFEPCLGRTLEPRDLSVERMQHVVEEMFAEEFGAEPAGAAYLLKRQIQRQLEKMLKEYQQPMAEENDIVLKGLEERISIHALGARFEGRLDRIEQRGDSIVILDYKTGSRPNKPPVVFGTLDIEERESWTDAITSLQLPMYLLLYSTHTKTAIERIIPANLYLGKNRLGKDCEVPFLEEREERAAGFEQMKQLIGLLLSEINNTAIPFSPPADLSTVCPRCPFTSLCGTAWVQGWKS
jgi:ATP-dependent helicase/DNAse subunit B